MNTLKLLLAEIFYRKVNFALSLFAISIAAALFVAGPMLVDGYQQETQAQLDRWDQQVVELETKVEKLRSNMKQVEQETSAELDLLESQTRRLMRDMGFNLMIVHRDTNMSDFWAADFAAHDMPQEYVNQLAADERLTLITHLVATLQNRIEWEDRKVLLVGYLPETTQSHMRKKAPMGYNIEPGAVFLGHELAVGRKVGETVTVSDRELKIARMSRSEVLGRVSRVEFEYLVAEPDGLRHLSEVHALGLFSTEEMIQAFRDGGFTEVDSKPGQGAVFTVYLPQDVREAPVEPEPPANPAPDVGSARILVVDDEDLVRDVARSMLEVCGFDVVDFSNGQDAVDYYRDHGDRVDLVLIDMVMPGMSGRECFKAIRGMDPDVLAVLSTGFGEDGEAREVVQDGMVGLVLKPFSRAALAATINEALSRNSFVAG